MNTGVAMDSALPEMEEALPPSAPSVTPQGAVAFGRGGGGNPTADTKMIAPIDYEPTNYSYKFSGNIPMPEGNKVKAYRRDAASLDDSALTRVLKSFDFGPISIKGFNNLMVSNIAFAEDRDYGYLISIDFASGTFGISENWNRWFNPVNQCNGDEKCISKNSLTIKDVPSDEKLIAIADDFLKSHDIDMSGYGTPKIQGWNQAEIMKLNSVSGYNGYIPETITLIYPQMVDGLPVMEEWGRESGLSVSVNIRHKKVSSVWNLRADQFTTITYEAEQNPLKIMEVLERGGIQYPYYEDATKTIEIPVGKPQRVWIKSYRYLPERGMSEELYLPALSFPITEKPDEVLYDNRDNVVIPLTKEALEQSGDNTIPIPLLEKSR